MWTVIDSLRPQFAKQIAFEARQNRLDMDQQEIESRKIVVFQPEIVELLLSQQNVPGKCGFV